MNIEFDLLGKKFKTVLTKSRFDLAEKEIIFYNVSRLYNAYFNNRDKIEYSYNLCNYDSYVYYLFVDKFYFLKHLISTGFDDLYRPVRLSKYLYDLSDDQIVDGLLEMDLPLTPAFIENRIMDWPKKK